MTKNRIASLFSRPRNRRSRQPSYGLALESLETRDLLTAIAGDSAEPSAVSSGDVVVAEVQAAAGPVEPGNQTASHKNAKSVMLEPGSDGLTSAISAAGPGGTVVVKSGVHDESAGVIVDIPVNIVGEPGAIIRVTTPLIYNPAGEAALLIQGADRVLVEGISLEATFGAGNVGIRIEDSQHVTVRNNRITGHLFAVIVESGDHAEISGNTLVGVPDPDIDWCCIGITNINGSHTRIIGNDVQEFDLGIFASGLKGHLQFNSLHANNVGLLMCTFSSSESPATRWHVANNNTYDNEFFGYIVTDFSTDNFLVNNAASGNGEGDILLEGGAFPSFDTLVALGSHKALDVIDDGIDNKVNGG